MFKDNGKNSLEFEIWGITLNIQLLKRLYFHFFIRKNPLKLLKRFIANGVYKIHTKIKGFTEKYNAK